MTQTMLQWMEFIAVEIAAAALFLVGVFILIPMSYFRMWKVAVVRPPGISVRAVEVWKGGKWTWLWGNDEDGVLGPEWYETRVRGEQIRAYLWCGWRNSANNLRWITARPGGVFYRREWMNGEWYIQAGYRPDEWGWPVLSLGRRKAPQ